MVAKSSNMPWYEGQCLLEALDNIQPEERDAAKPLRMAVIDTHDVKDIGAVVIGRVLTGTIRNGTKLSFGPMGTMATCKSITMHATREVIEQGSPGDLIGVNTPDIYFKEVSRGYIASDKDNQPAVDTDYFMA